MSIISRFPRCEKGIYEYNDSPLHNQHHMPNKLNAVRLVSVVVVICLLVLAATVWMNKRALNDATSQGGTVNTEGTDGPEIIIDKDKLDDLPEPETDGKTVDEVKENPTTVVPKTFNLDIPFYAQAPDGNWELPWKEACEEASLILAQYYLTDESLSKSQFKDDVLAMTKLEEQLFGTYIDTSVAQTAEVYEKFYGTGKTKIIDNPTIAQIKSEISKGNPIVAPFAGKKLGNSNFTNGGPRYHMLVIRGYDEKYFYTNDVGTKLGENFPYSYAVIMDALHDLVPV